MCQFHFWHILMYFLKNYLAEKLHVIFIISRFIKDMTFQCCLKVIYYIYLHSVKVIGVY